MFKEDCNECVDGGDMSTYCVRSFCSQSSNIYLMAVKIITDIISKIQLFLLPPSVNSLLHQRQSGVCEEWLRTLLS